MSICKKLLLQVYHNYTINNAYTQCNIYGAPSRQSHRESSLGLSWRWVCMQDAVVYIHHQHSILLSSKADRPTFTVPRKVEGWVDTGTAVRMYIVQPVPKAVHRSGLNDKHTVHSGIWSWILRTEVRHVTSRPLRPANGFNFIGRTT